MTPPVWLLVARALIGVREIKGPRHNPAIMGWVAAMGSRILGVAVTSDELAWCGTFVAHCLTKSGIGTEGRMTGKPIIAVRAKAWLEWGRVLSGPRLGCVLVFDRAGGGHVGFYVGEDASHYHVLGGNQGDAVSIMRLPRGRLLGMRWPTAVALPPASPIWLKPDGAPVSVNEA